MGAQAADWVVLKFGGTSVSSLDRWQTIADIVRQRLAEGARPLVVCSALSGVSNLLEAAIEYSPRGQHATHVDRIDAMHRELALALGVPFEAHAQGILDDLRRVLLGASLVEEVSPRQHARIMSAGELLSTRLGAAFLLAQGIDLDWVDARTCLRAVHPPDLPERARYLSAACSDALQPELAQRLAVHASAVLTQGFIASDERGHTVLLGRGGSDTSAAYLAAALGAMRCEIWTDVPGMFTANPHQIPQARLLRALDYDEAQEIASTGARVLHPRCIPPVRRHGIPLHIRCTPHPEVEGTVIGALPSGTAPLVKAVSARRGITLISMDTVGMWQQVGFLADVFQCFRRRGVSVDLVSTSESNVTVSLDPASTVDAGAVDELLSDLQAHCRARTIGPCASVSLVGSRIRALLHRLGPALEVFEEQEIHLLSQAASDLNLTFVVDESQAERLVARLHQLLFLDRRDDERMGPSWRDLFGPSPEHQPHHRWWQDRANDLIALAQQGTPTYVYDERTLGQAADALLGMQNVERCFFAMKANFHPEIIRLFVARGLGIECVSPGEIRHAMSSAPGLSPDRVLFTPNFAPREDYVFGFEQGVRVTLDNLHPLLSWPEVFQGRDVLVRIDPGVGRGHHAHVRTGGARSKFGVSLEQLDRLEQLVAEHDVRVVGLHAHAGSGIRTPANWAETAVFLAGVAQRFPHVRSLDLGGGLGVPERPEHQALDIAAVDASLAPIRAAHPGLELWLEPGRYLVAMAGVLLTRVTQLKQKSDLHYVGVDAGMHTLIRPALYGSWHRIVNLDGAGRDGRVVANVVGPICETGDTLGYERTLVDPREGDVLLVDVVGAYGRVMSSDYNLRGRPTEHMLGPRQAPA